MFFFRVAFLLFSPVYLFAQPFKRPLGFTSALFIQGTGCWHDSAKALAIASPNLLDGYSLTKRGADV